MATNGYKVFDSDLHVMEPHDLWQRYVDPAFSHRVRGFDRGPMDMGVEVDSWGEPFTFSQYKGDTNQPIGVAEQAAEEQNRRFIHGQDRGFDPVSQLQAMDKEGIDVCVLFPSRGLSVLSVVRQDPELAAAICRAYNDWLYDFCQESPDRMYGSAMVSPNNVEAAVAETRRMAEKGFRSIFMRSNQVDDRNWHDPHYDPLWAECQRLNIAVGIHPGGMPLDPSYPHIGSQFSTIRMWHVCHSLNTQLAVIDLIGGGVPERFPELRIAFLEANCSWVPWLLWRMDEQQEFTTRYGTPPLKLAPSEYFRRQCFASIEPGEEPAEHVAEQGYEDNLVFSTDYPHPDSAYPYAVETLLKLPLKEQTMRKLLWDNCARLYNLQ